MSLDGETIEAELDRLGSAVPVRVLETTGSTNADALEWAEEGAPAGAVVVADHQAEGRGRKGRTWLSEPGRALLFSVVLRPKPDRVALLSTAVGVGACEAIRSLTHLSVLLKWPNDLVVEDRKLAGILVESRFSTGREPIAIAGMGMNVSWGPDALPDEIAERATSIGIEVDRVGLDDPPSRESLLAHVLAGIDRRYAQLQKGDVTDLVTTAQSLSSLIGREVVVRLPGGDAITGTATGLDEDGRLELVTPDGHRALNAGEVETVRKA